MTNAISALFVAFGVLLMWCAWKDYGWFYSLVWTPKVGKWGQTMERTEQEREWERLVTRFGYFVVGLAIVIWHLGGIFGFWPKAVDGPA